MTKQTDDQGAAYVPSPQQIRRHARRIRASWDSKTYCKRLVLRDLPPPWTVPEIADTNTAQHGVTRKLNANIDART